MPAREVRYEQQAIVGVRESQDPSLSLPDHVQSMMNLYPLNPELGGGVTSRPGFVPLGTSSPNGSTGTLRAMGQFTRRDGTEYTWAIQGSHLWTYTWATGVWVDKGAIPNGTTFGYWTVFADKLIYNPSDGLGKPWSWDGTTFTALSNAPVAYGRPTVYYAKLFFVKWAERGTIVWSEENQPNTGYEAGGYNNAWTLQQTDQAGIFAIEGMNEALYVWRARSITAITGAVNADFQSTGTREGVSQHVGTTWPGSVTVRGREIWFLDADLRPHLLEVGGAVVPLWKDAEASIARWRVSTETGLLVSVQEEFVWGADYVRADLVVFSAPFAFPVNGSALMLVFNGTTRSFGGTWERPFTTGIRATTGAIVKDGNGLPVLGFAAESGDVSAFGDPVLGTTWTDSFLLSSPGLGGIGAGMQNLPIRHVITGPAWGYDTRMPKRFDVLDLGLVTLTDLSGLRVGIATPSEDFALVELPDLANLVSYWDVLVWDTDAWSVSLSERHQAVGLDALARWARVELAHENGAERLWLTNWSVTALLEPAEPAVA